MYTHALRLVAAAAAAALLLLLGSPATAQDTQADSNSDNAVRAAPGGGGSCGGGFFFSLPPDGSRVLQGQTIAYFVATDVLGGSVLGCSRDVHVPPFLEYVAALPGGTYFPSAYPGLTFVSVEFGGPLEVGRYYGVVIMRVPFDTPAGTVIEASSLQTSRLTVVGIPHGHTNP